MNYPMPEAGGLSKAVRGGRASRYGGEKELTVKALEHITIRCTQLSRTRDFYCRMLGLTDGERPAFPFRGHWLYLGGVPVVHLVEAADHGGAWSRDGERPGLAGHAGSEQAGPSTPGPGETGAFDHIAFHGQDFDAMRASLVAANVSFRERVVPGGRLKQLFVPDPEGVLVEINFRT
jgi:catechol 2,3-dioxygenase-like lactoylglutathione lyase family enzyme